MKNGVRCETLLAGIVLTAAQACDRAPAPEVTLRGDRFDPVRSLIDKRVREHGIVSLAIAVAKYGEIVWEEAFGWADLDQRKHAMPHSIYAQASVTKSFTATGLMLLVERGLVGLEDPVNDYLGDSWLISHVGDPAEATVRLVLRHASGLPTHANVFFSNEASAPPDQDESIRRYGFIADRLDSDRRRQPLPSRALPASATAGRHVERSRFGGRHEPDLLAALLDGTEAAEMRAVARWTFGRTCFPGSTPSFN